MIKKEVTVTISLEEALDNYTHKEIIDYVYDLYLHSGEDLDVLAYLINTISNRNVNSALIVSWEILISGIELIICKDIIIMKPMTINEVIFDFCILEYITISNI